jgi:hypothetical protein
MRYLPVSYPSDDDVPYLAHFAPNFSHVFVMLNPFVRVDGDVHQDDRYCLMTDEVRTAAELQGASSGVSWAEIGKLSGLPSPRRVNRALRLTGSRRIKPELASEKDTQQLLECCRRHNVSLPDEGRFSPSLVIAIERFLRSLGRDKVLGAGGFGIDPEELEVHSLLVNCPPEIYGLDGTLYISMWTDHHYGLVCQSDAGRQRSSPSHFFEGFEADGTTTDFWGIGSIEGE